MNPKWSQFYAKSAMAKIFTGVLDWSLLSSFPHQKEPNSKELSHWLAEVDQFMKQNTNAAQIEQERKIPREYFEALKKTPFNKFALSVEEGGLALTRFEKFKLLERAIGHSVSAGFSIGVTNAFGIGSILEAMPAGPARNFVLDKIRAGANSCFADTEPKGAANDRLSTHVVLSEDAQFYILNGEKMYINNGVISDVILVSAHVQDEKNSGSAVFVLDTSTPGVEVKKVHELMGLRGAPMTAFVFKNVKIPVELKVKMDAQNWRDTLHLGPLIALGRFYGLGAASMVLAKKSFTWASKACADRKVNGRPLIEYDEIKRNLATTESEIFALETLVQWCLLDSEGLKIADRWWEVYASKNLTTMTATAIVDRSLSLFGAEGYETAASKVALGLPDIPMEQLYRDVRGLRISGGVDFYIDYNAAMQWLDTFFYNPDFLPEKVRGEYLKPIDSPELSPTNQGNLNFVQKHTEQFYSRITKAVLMFPKKQELFEQERLLILLNQVSCELFMMSLVLGRVAQAWTAVDSDLADTYCSHCSFRLAKLEMELDYELNKLISKS